MRWITRTTGAAAALLFVLSVGGGCVVTLGGDDALTPCPDSTHSTECDGFCVDTATDADHCGGCYSPCELDEVCVQGSCEAGCTGGTIQCGTTCVDTSVDPDHCGGCDQACGPNEACAEASCVALEPTTLDVGPSGAPYTDPEGARGYWFVAPSDLSIVGVRVPINVIGPQNVQVMRLAGVPAHAPEVSVDLTTLAYARGVPGADFVPVQVQVRTGDIIGVLGARGTGLMHNSYGQTASYETTIGGEQVTLYRLFAEANLHETPATAVATEDYNYARVELEYFLE